MISRRRILKGMGGLAVGLPVLRKFIDPSEVRAHGGSMPMQRIIAVAHAMGTIRALFTPDAQGPNFEFGTVTEPMSPFKDRTIAISNLCNAALERTDGRAGHPGKQESAFTGTLQTGAFSTPGSNHVDDVVPSYSPEAQTLSANGPSVETLIGQQLQGGQHLFPAVNLGIASQRDWSSAAGPSTFFYEGAANPVTLTYHPRRAFESLFAEVSEDGTPDPALLALRRRRKSVLDGVREAFVDLRQGLDAHDRAILDDHADKIREIELDLPDAAACSIPDDIPDADDEFAAYRAMDFTMTDYADLQVRMMVHAMACGIAPVGRLQFGRQHRPDFGIPLVDDAVAQSGDNWHTMVHKANGWESEDPVRIAGFRFYIEQFASLVGQLDAIVEGPDGQTLLDNSLVVLGSDLGDGDGHRARDLNFLLCGGMDGARWGYHYAGLGRDTPEGGAITNNLWVTLLQLAGVTDDDGSPRSTFGLEGLSSGPIEELLA